MSNDAASAPSRVYSSESLSASVAVRGEPTSTPAAVFSATSRSAEAPSPNTGAALVVVVSVVPVPACDQSLSISPFFARTCTE